MRTTLLILAFSAILPLSSMAETYSWTDSSGTVHFTDDPGAVPPRYRDKALRQEYRQEQAKPQPEKPVAAKETAAPAPGKPEKPVIQPLPSISDAKPADKNSRYGDKTAEEWQQEFMGLKAELKAVEKQFEELRLETGNGKKILSNQRVAEINALNRKLVAEYEAVRIRYNSLVDQANKAGLPPEFAM